MKYGPALDQGTTSSPAIVHGTGCFFTGADLIASRNRRSTTVAWKIGDGPLQYALEGGVFVAVAATQWLRDGLRIIRTAPEVNEVASAVRKLRRKAVKRARNWEVP